MLGLVLLRVAVAWQVSAGGWLLEALHHSHGTVLLDQALMALPFVLLGGWQLRGRGGLAATLLGFPLLLGAFGVLVYLRLKYLGFAE